MERSGIEELGAAHTSQVAADLPEICSGSAFRILENDALRVVIAPTRGGKIVSLFSKQTGTEWLLPPLRPYAEATTTAGFDAWDGGGFDECLPTIAATDSAPDHGELWRSPWREEPAPTGVALSTVACGGAIHVHRHASLDGPALILEYRITNQSSTEKSILYSAHPLLRVEENDRILLPHDVKSVAIAGSSGDRLGPAGHTVTWPKTDAGPHRSGGENLSIVGPPDGLQADKLFAGPLTSGPLTSGWCSLFRPSLGEGIDLAFSAEILPYLGIWICRAAWPDAGAAKQYTVAFEPTNANCDSLADAEQNGTAWRLKPAEHREWTLTFHLTTESPAAGDTDDRG